MASIHPDFAQYCCELLSGVGRCTAKRMFGGWGISTDGLTLAILANLGQGDTLWLKAGADSRTAFEAAGCARFTYTAQGKPRGMDYYSAPDEAMESPALMLPWARLALQAAIAAHSAKAAAKPKAKPAKPPRSR